MNTAWREQEQPVFGGRRIRRSLVGQRQRFLFGDESTSLREGCRQICLSVNRRKYSTNSWSRELQFLHAKDSFCRPKMPFARYTLGRIRIRPKTLLSVDFTMALSTQCHGSRTRSSLYSIDSSFFFRPNSVAK